MHSLSSLQKRDVYLWHVELQPRLLQDGFCSLVDGILHTLRRGRQDEVRARGKDVPSLHNLMTPVHRQHGLEEGKTLKSLRDLKGGTPTQLRRQKSPLLTW